MTSNFDNDNDLNMYRSKSSATKKSSQAQARPALKVDTDKNQPSAYDSQSFFGDTTTTDEAASYCGVGGGGGSGGMKYYQHDDHHDIGGEYIPGSVTESYKNPLFDHQQSPIPSHRKNVNFDVNPLSPFQQQQQQVHNHNHNHDHDHNHNHNHLSDLEFNINPQAAMSPTLGLSEAEWKAIPFSTRRRLKAAVQQQYGSSGSELSPESSSQDFNSLPSSVVGNAPKAIPFSKRRERSTTMYPSFGSRSHSFASMDSGSNPNSPAFQFLSKFGNPSTDTTSGAPGNNGGYQYNEDLGEQVGDYIIGKLIGYGGFSQVKEAHTIEGGKKIVRAVKIVQKWNPASTPEYMERIQNEFDHEVSIWKTLNHENILKLIMVENNPKAVYCFTEKIGGGTLFDAVKHNRGTLEENVIKQYIYQLGSALLYLHETMKVVHRDVKLENCLIDDLADGSTRVLLCDFGMSEYYEQYQESEHAQESPTKNPQSQHVIGPSDTSSLFNQYHYHNHNHHHHHHHHHHHQSHDTKDRLTTTANRPIDTPSIHSHNSTAGSSAVLTPRHGAGDDGSESEKGDSENVLTSHHSRHHHHHLDSAINSPHTPSSTPTGVRGWASPVQTSTNTTQNFGSLPYACPQLLQANAPVIEPSVDMWSFGVVIHALYMGHLPWNHVFLPKLRMMILSGQWDQEAMVAKAGHEAVQVTQACLDMNNATRATVRQVMEHDLLKNERRKYGPKGRRIDDDELMKWSQPDGD